MIFLCELHCGKIAINHWHHFSKNNKNDAKIVYIRF
jgi:hypothetical protein